MRGFFLPWNIVLAIAVMALLIAVVITVLKTGVPGGIPNPVVGGGG